MNEVGSLLTQALDVFKQFKDVGLLVGLAAAINLLVNVTKLPVVEKWLNGVKPLRGVLAVVLGVGTGLVTALSQGKPVSEVVLMAVGGGLAGSGSVALHELVQNVKTLYSAAKVRFTS